MNKKLNIPGSLLSSSAFVRHTPSREVDVQPVYPQPEPEDTPLNVEPSKQEINQPVSHATKKAISNDIMQSSTISRYRDITISAIRKSVKTIGKETTLLRLTPEEKSKLADIVYTYKKKGVRTSENEINRIALNFLIEDYKTNNKSSILSRVIEALNA